MHALVLLCITSTLNLKCLASRIPNIRLGPRFKKRVPCWWQRELTALDIRHPCDCFSELDAKKLLVHRVTVIYRSVVYCVLQHNCWISLTDVTPAILSRDFVAQLLSSDKVAARNCACRTLRLCRINKHWPISLVNACLCDKVAVCDMHSCILQLCRTIKLRHKIAQENRRCDIGRTIRGPTNDGDSMVAFRRC